MDCSLADAKDFIDANIEEIQCLTNKSRIEGSKFGNILRALVNQGYIVDDPYHPMASKRSY